MHKQYVITQSQHNYHIQLHLQAEQATTLISGIIHSVLISGATNSTYTSPALTANTNFYCAVTSGSCGTLTSNTVIISVYGNLTSGVIGNAQIDML